jgi:glycosyltransferase involved in cell wall biosynthesis
MGMGGADQQLLSSAEALRSRGWDVRIVSLTRLGLLGMQARQHGIPTQSLDMPRGIPDPRGLIRLLLLLRRWKPDILHSHMVHANLMARLLRPFTGVPVLISTIHSIQDGGRFRLLGYRLTNRLADCTTIVSEAAAQRYLTKGAVSRERLRVVPNAVDTERFRPLPGSRDQLRRDLELGDSFTWLAVGRFAPAKDHPNMFAAFLKVCARRPDSLLLLVGIGPLQSQAEDLVRSLGLSGRVRFLGVRRDVPELMSAADGYVLSSAWEGMPVVLLEAAAAGMPVVATAVGGNQEVVLNGETGFVVSPGDPDALAEAMMKLAALSPPARRDLGQRAREHIESNFALPHIVDRWEELYRGLMAGRNPAGLPDGRLQRDVAETESAGGQR